eukprot:1144585-Pelagomonas_calceolata.AAC.3
MQHNHKKKGKLPAHPSPCSGGVGGLSWQVAAALELPASSCALIAWQGTFDSQAPPRRRPPLSPKTSGDPCRSRTCK